MEKVRIEMTMYDEFGEYTSIEKEFEFAGSRGPNEADCICSLVESFLRATEFARVCDEYDVQLVEK